MLCPVYCIYNICNYSEACMKWGPFRKKIPLTTQPWNQPGSSFSQNRPHLYILAITQWYTIGQPIQQSIFVEKILCQIAGTQHFMSVISIHFLSNKILANNVANVLRHYHLSYHRANASPAEVSGSASSAIVMWLFHCTRTTARLPFTSTHTPARHSQKTLIDWYIHSREIILRQDG